MSRYTVLDLFSGAGGMSWGFQSHDRFQLIGAVDVERAKPSSGDGSTSCNQTYQANIGVKPLAADLSKVSPSEISTHFGFARGDLDVLISCAPCTGFSQKQARNHVEDDTRNALVPRTAIYVDAFRPQYLVMENVKELVRGRHSHHYQDLCRELAKLGYEVFAEVHNLVEFGLPQHRIRTLLVARRDDRAIRLQFNRVRQFATVRSAIAHLPPLKAGECSSVDPMHLCPGITDTSLARMRAIPLDGGSWIDIPEELAHLRIPSMNVKKLGSFPDIYGRLAWDRPAPTITRECGHPGNGRYTHPGQDRLLSVREMSLLQGFPADYVFCGNLSSKYRQIGDAVPPLVSQMVARAIADDLAGLTAPAIEDAQLSLI